MEKTLNFLNNQRYIFGKGESKKLVAQYNTSKLYKKLIQVLGFINSLIYNPRYVKKIGSKTVNTFFIVFLYLVVFTFTAYETHFGEELIVIGVLSPIFFISLYFVIKDFRFNPILTLNDYFFVEGISLFNYAIYIIFVMTFVIPYSGDVHHGIIIFISLVLLAVLSGFTKTLNLINILLFPIIIILGGIFYTCIYFFMNKNRIQVIKYIRKNTKLYNDFYEITKK